MIPIDIQILYTNSKSKEPNSRFSHIKIQGSDLLVKLIDDKTSPCVVEDQHGIRRRFWISQFERGELK